MHSPSGRVSIFDSSRTRTLRIAPPRAAILSINCHAPTALFSLPDLLDKEIHNTIRAHGRMERVDWIAVPDTWTGKPGALDPRFLSTAFWELTDRPSPLYDSRFVFPTEHLVALAKESYVVRGCVTVPSNAAEEEAGDHSEEQDEDSDKGTWRLHMRAIEDLLNDDKKPPMSRDGRAVTNGSNGVQHSAAVPLAKLEEEEEEKEKEEEEEPLQDQDGSVISCCCALCTQESGESMKGVDQQELAWVM